MWYMLVVWYNMGKTPYVVWYVGGMVREKHRIRYGMLAVWHDGTVSWMYSMAKFALWYDMVQYMRSVKVEYVV